ncbi:hypothetical protein [Microbacterium jejuense]|uniref:hypothetical protein n=1 Tax=Microbacterium jejuense TaxID=1263637 RepID=UPI0031F12EE3
MTFITNDCVTNTLELLPGADRPRPCLQKVFDDESGRWVPAHWATCDNPNCRGCVPREAEHGKLCRTCYSKITDALSRVEELIVHFRSIDKTAQAIGERVDTSMTKSIVIPDAWLAADGLMEALGAPPIPSTASIDDTFELARQAVGEWADVDSIIATREGAKRAVVLVKRLQTALKRWPDAEVLYRPIPWFVCEQCRTRGSLWRRSPVEQGDDLLIECGTPDCGWSAEWFGWIETHKQALETFAAEWMRMQKEGGAA